MSTDQRYPGELPLWLAEGHVLDTAGLTDDVMFEQGETRDRQIYTRTRGIASVSALFSQAQYDRWVDFFEQELEAGARSFDTQLVSLSGTVLEWWTVQVVAPPVEATLSKSGELGNLYRVSLKVFMLDGPSVTREASTLRGRSDAATRLEATSLITADDGVLRGLSSAITVNSGSFDQPHLRGRSDVTTVLTGEIDIENLLLVTGDSVLLVGGGVILLGHTS